MCYFFRAFFMKSNAMQSLACSEIRKLRFTKIKSSQELRFELKQLNIPKYRKQIDLLNCLFNF